MLTIDQAFPGQFTAAESLLLQRMQDPPVHVMPRQHVVRANAPVTHSAFLATGYVGRYRSDMQGRRQFLSLQIPGDFIDLPSYMLGSLDHDLDSFTEVAILRMAHERLSALRSAAPEIHDKLWRITLIDAAIQRYSAFRVGRLQGRARIANLFAELFVRHFSRGLCDARSFPLPLTQADLGEACGMTPVHANRMLTELRGANICTLTQNQVHIHDLPGLVQTGQFEWDYLYLPAPVSLALVGLFGPSKGPRNRPPRGTNVL